MECGTIIAPGNTADRSNYEKACDGMDRTYNRTPTPFPRGRHSDTIQALCLSKNHQGLGPS